MATAALSLSGDRAARSAENDTTRLDPAQAAFFETRVQPILKARCFKCHGGEAKVRGNFRVDSRAAVLSGGDHGPAITLERPEAPRSRTGSTSRTFTPRCSPSSASIPTACPTSTAACTRSLSASKVLNRSGRSSEELSSCYFRGRSRRTVTFLPLILLARSAVMTASARSSGTSTSENRSEMSISPTWRPVRPASPVMAPTRS